MRTVPLRQMMETMIQNCYQELTSALQQYVCIFVRVLLSWDGVLIL